MPGGDRTGPQGLGAMTGRAAGFCAGYAAPGYMNPVGGRGFGYGRGFGRGRGFSRGFGFGRGWGARANAYNTPYYAGTYPAYPYNPNVSAQQEADMLKEESKGLQEEIRIINDRIRDLENQSQKQE